MVLDEIDKLGSDYRGDPSSALLEVLDAEQNDHFRDHYHGDPGRPVATCFSFSRPTRSTPSRARCSTAWRSFELSSYTDEEKLQIAKQHLLPKQRKKHGLKQAQLRVSDDAIREIVTLYTRESGVRVLERSLAAVCRKTAKRIALGECKSVQLRAGSVAELSRPRALRAGACLCAGRGRPCARPCVDVRRRGEYSMSKSPCIDGSGQARADRQPRQRHEGVGAGRRHLYSQPCTAARHRPGVL